MFEFFDPGRGKVGIGVQVSNLVQVGEGDQIRPPEFAGIDQSHQAARTGYELAFDLGFVDVHFRGPALQRKAAAGKKGRLQVVIGENLF